MSSFYASHGKRALDVALATLALLLAAPVLLCITSLLVVLSGRPIFFRQERPGLGGRVFSLWKFRTMREARSTDGQLLPDAERLTPVGRFLRRWSLDEIPELWNVLRGDMSFVGPRPLLAEYLPLYSELQARRHEVRPGITGWAQVNGRNAMSWDERLAFDVWYVDNVRASLDVTIMIRTVVLVLSGRGISAPNHATMPAFTGSPREPGK